MLSIRAALCPDYDMAKISIALTRFVPKLGWNRFVKQHSVIVDSIHLDEWHVWCEKFGVDAPAARRLRPLASFDIVAKAAAAGLGLAMGRSPLSDGLLREGRLVPLYPERELTRGWY